MLKKAGVLCIVLNIVAGTAYASDIDKLKFIQQHFAQESRHSQWWQNGWLTVVSGNAAINAAATQQADNRAERVDSGTALTVSALGIYSSVSNPMKLHEYHQTLLAMPQSPGKEAQQTLIAAEQMLKDAAQREAHEQSRRNRLTSAAIHGIAGLIVSTEGTGAREGLIRFLSGVAFSELKIRTAPKQSIQAWRDYQSGQISADRPTFRRQLSVAFDGVMLSATLAF